MEKTIGELIQSYDNALIRIKELEGEVEYYKKELENRDELLKRTNIVEDMVKDIVSNEIIVSNEVISEEEVEDTESEDEIKEKKIELVIKTKKGRPSKYNTEEERKAAKDNQDKERRERNKSAK
jgi:hypothetical protein